MQTVEEMRTALADVAAAARYVLWNDSRSAPGRAILHEVEQLAMQAWALLAEYVETDGLAGPDRQHPDTPAAADLLRRLADFNRRGEHPSLADLLAADPPSKRGHRGEVVRRLQRCGCVADRTSGGHTAKLLLTPDGWHAIARMAG